ncbi:hypothetical protein CYY_008348 [Polysphondylium violaceum]|uniref:CBS domain-containing protein n=1 Tax=Polysphondylium violaceum TaxID=133409 RepID=A0A8J4PVD2_9MYCE|nr:hypothetical protein CYY_008348 [Polysphondylium violaceum]
MTLADLGTVLKLTTGGIIGAVLYWSLYGREKTEDEINRDRENSAHSNSGNIGLNSSGSFRHKRSRSGSNLTSSTGGGGDSNAQLIDLLHNTMIEYILNEKTSHVITIDSTATLDYALMRMNENQVISLPVVDLSTKQYIGMLSIVDIAAFLSQFPSEDSPNTPVSEVLKYNRVPFLPLYVNSPIQMLIHVMAHHVPQVPIMSRQTIVVDIVSRLNVLSFINENIEALGNKANSSIKSLDLLSKTISTVNQNSKVIEAINLMNVEQTTELAVIDDEGKIVGNFSAADLRKLSIYSFNRCYEPISKFITLEPENLNIVIPSTTLRSTICKFVENDAPILWIVDNQMKPVSSITHIGLMKYLLNLSTSLSDTSTI